MQVQDFFHPNFQISICLFSQSDDILWTGNILSLYSCPEANQGGLAVC